MVKGSTATELGEWGEWSEWTGAVVRLPISSTRGRVPGEEAQGALGAAALEPPVELGGVAAQAVLADAHLVLGAVHDHVLAHLLAEEVQGAAQRGAGMLRVEIGPEEGQEGVAALET